jgi:2,3-bisphosphoglycerate-independent phosphoglycerate mutase
MKIILVLLDGLGDRSYAILGHRTPLQAANTPNLVRLAALGSNGLFHASVCGQCLPSEAAHYFLFGYDLKYFPGRGLLEAVGLELNFEDRDVLSLAHLSEVAEENGILVLRHGPEVFHGDKADIEALMDGLTPYETMGVQFKLHKKPFINDAILVMSGNVSPCISDCDPIIPGRRMARVVALSENANPDRAQRTAKALNAYLAYCHHVLQDHEVNCRRKEQNRPRANFLATQRCGQRIKQESFKNLWGLSAMLIASGPVYGGLAHELGMTFVQTKDGNDPGGDLRERVRMALHNTDHDFFHVHTKMPDEAAHTGNPEWKTAVITSLDRGLDELVDAVGTRDDLLVAVTADHSTASISELIHSGEPVPVVLAGPDVRQDDVQCFDEVQAAKGCLGFLRGRELMLMLLNYSDRSSFFSHRLGSNEKAYVPSDYEPFPVNGNLSKKLT